MQKTIVALVALVLAAALTYMDKQLPAEAWALVGLVIGGGLVPRPGDVTPEGIARALEAADPTHRV